MKSKPAKLALFAIAGCLLFAAKAQAVNLLLNSSFETYSGGGNIFGQRGTNDWYGYFALLNHATDVYYDGVDIPTSEGPGTYYSWSAAADWGMWDNFSTPEDETFFLNNEIYAYALSQTVALSNAVSAASIDSGFGQYTLSAWLASYTGNPEQPFVLLRFFDDTATQSTSTGTQIGNDSTTSVIFDRCSSNFAVVYADGTSNFLSDLSLDHKWIKYVATGTIPANARKARIYLTRSPNAGKVNSPDTYFDLVKFDVVDSSQSGPVAPKITTPPASQTVLVGNSISFSVSAIGDSLTYLWLHNKTNVLGSTTSSLNLTAVQFSDAGIYEVVVTNVGGATTSTPPATLTVLNPLVYVTGQWDFKGNLAATVGSDLQYGDPTVQADTTFGTTTTFGIPKINGVDATVMHFVPPGGVWGGYLTFHGAAPNGGGTNVNQYTLVYDVYYPPASDLTWRSLWQTDLSNSTDGDLFVDDSSNGIGISGIYDGVVDTNSWHRLAFAFDLTGPGQAPVLTKFIDGVKVGTQGSGLSGMDGRFSVLSSALLFADNDGDVAEAYVSSVQFSNGRRPDAFLEALGGPSANKIPGAIVAKAQGSSVVITWTGGVPLQTATSLNGTWTTINGVTNSYTPPAGDSARYFRPKIP